MKLIMMQGISGSGKSTIAKKLAEAPHTYLLSSDELRIELYGSLREGNKHNGDVFEHLHKEMLDTFNGDPEATVIYDAMNLNRKQRTHVYNLVKSKHPECEVVSHIVFRDPQTAKEQNVMRDKHRHVPNKVIERQFINFQIPRVGVDTDKIIADGDNWFTSPVVIDRSDILGSVEKSAPMLSYMLKMNRQPHDTPYHLESIDEHIQMVGENAPDDLLVSAVFHDLGKGYVKGRGQNEGRLGYYIGHANVGAQLLLNYGLNYPEEVKVDDAEIIHQHMAHYQLDQTNEKQIANWQRKNGLSDSFTARLETFSNLDSEQRIVQPKLEDAVAELSANAKTL